MSKRPQSNTEKAGRDERLRAALRANLARRKAQGRARAAADEPDDGDETADGENTARGGTQEEAKADDGDDATAPHRPKQER